MAEEELRVASIIALLSDGEFSLAGKTISKAMEVLMIREHREGGNRGQPHERDGKGTWMTTRWAGKGLYTRNGVWV